MGYHLDKTELTPRMLEVLRCASQGMSQRESAKALGVEISTISTIRAHALHRLGARNMLHAVSLAYERGLFD
jgi:DNA-binding CsgD family transcriptional regulator